MRPSVTAADVARVYKRLRELERECRRRQWTYPPGPGLLADIAAAERAAYAYAAGLVQTILPEEKAAHRERVRQDRRLVKSLSQHR